MPRTVSYPAVADAEAGVIIARSRHGRAYLSELGPSGGVVLVCDLTPEGWRAVASLTPESHRLRSLPPCFTLRADWREALDAAYPPDESETA